MRKRDIFYSFIVAGGVIIFVAGMRPVNAQSLDDQRIHIMDVNGDFHFAKGPDDVKFRQYRPNSFFETRQQRIEQLYEEGKISIEEADKRIDRLERINEMRLEQQASILNITVSEMKRELENGNTFKDLAREKGISKSSVHEQMREKMLEARRDHFDDLIDKGELTEDQANRYLKRLEDRQKRIENR